jgi:hypothetical protein
MAVKARQLMRSAKMAKYKRDLAEAGVSLSLPKPSAKAMREKEEELKRLYREMFPEKAEEKSVHAEEEEEEPEVPEEEPEEEEEYEEAQETGEEEQF